LYVVQYLLLPVVTSHRWYVLYTHTHTHTHTLLSLIQHVTTPTNAYTTTRLPSILSNTLYLVATFHSTYITFLGYNALPFLSSTQLLLAPPLLLYTLLWAAACGSGWNTSVRLAPVLWCAGRLRKPVGGGAAAASSSAP